MPRSTVLASIAVLSFLAVAGCGGTGPATAASAEEALQRGTAAMEARRYDRAVEHFAAALDFGRATTVAREAQLGLARALAGDRQHLRAGQEYTRFIEFYPDDPRREEVEFERVQTYAALSPEYQLDQTDTQTAIDYIRARPEIWEVILTGGDPLILSPRRMREMMERHGETWADLTPKSEDVNLHLLHLIASHHGTLEWGSPVRPKTLEAILLHQIDS